MESTVIFNEKNELVKIIKLKRTCPACPTQYEGRTEHSEEVYFRYRHGEGYIEIDGVKVYRFEIKKYDDGFLAHMDVVEEFAKAGYDAPFEYEDEDD